MIVQIIGTFSVCVSIFFFIASIIPPTVPSEARDLMKLSALLLICAAICFK